MNTRATRKRPFLRFTAVFATLLVVTYVAVSVFVAYRIWHPVRKALHTTPAAYGLTYEEVRFPSAGDGIPLKGWFIDSPGANTVLVMHGSNSIRDNYINMEVAKALVQHGYDVLTFDFRGHGESGGDLGSLGPREARDVAGALAYLKTRGVTTVGSLAYSMGASAELLAAPDHPEMKAIVADSSYARLITILDNQRSKIWGFSSIFSPGILLMSKALYGVDPLTTEPERAVARLGDRPVFLIQSSVDDLVPVSEAYELKKAGASDPNLTLWVAPGSGHVTAFADNRAEYVSRVVAFFDKYLAGKK
jgi:pimeloyl-ACP methyl ester carboxylesterase